MKIAISSDHGGYNLKKEIVTFLKSKGYDVHDLGPNSTDSVDYPDYAKPLSVGVANGEYDKGILICGTGIGMSIAANKVNGVRCSVVHDTFTAHQTRKHNNANVLAMGERVIGAGLALDIVDVWLNTEFEGGRHERRVQKIEG